MSRHDTLTPTSTNRGIRLTGYAVGVVAVIALVTVSLVLVSVFNGGRGDGATQTADTANVPAAWERPAVSADGLIGRSGVKIEHVALTAEGGLLDLRFKVVDPDKAAAVHDAAYPPAIVDESTGLVVNQLFMGHAHGGGYDAGLTYYLVFENPGNLVQRGSRVAVLLGDAQVEHVVVQ